MRFFPIILTVLSYMTVFIQAENWPAWRGPHDSGSTAKGPYPANLSDPENLAWKLTLPGKGCSTPIVWENQIFITGPQKGHDTVSAITWEGKVAWEKSIGKERAGKHRNGSGSNPSCVTDGQLVFAYFKSGNFAAVTREGKEVWKKNLTDYGKDTLFWDFGTSPVLTQKHVIMALMRKGNSWLVAFEKRTGKVAWQVERNYETPIEGDHSYATPIVTTQNGREAILVWGAERFTAHDAANGDILWTCSGFNPQAKKFWVVVSSFVLVDDMAVIPYGRGARLAGIQLNGKGDVTTTNRKWTLEGKGSFVPSPAAQGGKVYLVRDRGEVLCVNPRDGKVEWTGAFPKDRASYYSSPTIADGKIYAAREDGTVFVANFQDGFKLLTENDMGERVIASPVPVNGSLLIRGEKTLFCYRKK
jgi:outer membrane protein assembly factor BamB